jgi:hypothetical protein
VAHAENLLGHDAHIDGQRLPPPPWQQPAGEVGLGACQPTKVNTFAALASSVFALTPVRVIDPSQLS